MTELETLLRIQELLFEDATNEALELIGERIEHIDQVYEDIQESLAECV